MAVGEIRAELCTIVVVFDNVTRSVLEERNLGLGSLGPPEPLMSDLNPQLPSPTNKTNILNDHELHASHDV